MKRLTCIFLMAAFVAIRCTQPPELPDTGSQAAWPDSMMWWKANNLRMIQTNLPAYEAANLNVDSLIEDLQTHHANVLLINAGGIMAFYPTELDFQYTNPYMQENMLGDAIEKCHALGIRVIVRFDFSRAHESIYKAHPDWFYISPSGERIINTDMYLISINAPYLQEKSHAIVAEVIDRYPIDGIFINMPGYHTSNAYEGTYHGIDQNPYDKTRFKAFSGGLDLPLKEDIDDPVFRKYGDFKTFTVDDWLKTMHDMIKSKNPQIAICTYRDQNVDIIRYESHPSGLPYWPYSASDNVNSIESTYPNHIVSNSSIQQISFQSRYNAVEPEEVSIRLYENIANGSGLDISLMGDMRGYEDERNFGVVKKLYAHHEKYEAYYGNYISPAEVAVISPGYWPGGDPMREYRGLQLMLKEAHIQFDNIEAKEIANLAEKIKRYKLIILPQITHLGEDGINVLLEACKNGTMLIATNNSFYDDPETLETLFGAKILDSDHDGAGNYLQPLEKNIFTRFEGQTMVHWKFNLGLYDLSDADERYLSILSKGRPGPPEKIGGHEPTGYNALSIKYHGSGKAAILPASIGKLYYIHGYEQHKNIMLDLVEYLYPEIRDLVKTNAHPRVEVILQEYIENIPENIGKTEPDGLILHLVNITGFSGNTFFEPLPVRNLEFSIRSDFNPVCVYAMQEGKSLDFNYGEGYVHFTLDHLIDFEGIILAKK